jgi:nicotinate-nucleotide--dimethylbenzimidazole phosphoribosyltransferase
MYCKQHNIELSIVDAGVNYDFPTNTKLISNKIAMGTQSFTRTCNVSAIELEPCFKKKEDVVAAIAKMGPIALVL